MVNPIRLLSDGLSNLVTRLGQKSASDTYVLPTVVDQMEIEAAYRTGWFRKIVDIVPFDMVREWRDWQAEADQIETIEAEEKRLGIQGKLRHAMILDRLYGGAAILLGAPGSPAAPLRLDAIQEGGLRYIHAVSSLQLHAGELDRDPMSETFMQPKVYTIGRDTGQVDIHPTRVLRLVFNPIPELVQSTAWGDPLWYVMSRAVKNVDLSAAAIAELLHVASTDVIGIPKLSEKVSTTEYEAKLTKRFDIFARIRSMSNVTLRDIEEEWEQRTASFANLPEVMMAFMAFMCGLADVPATRMLGKSPDGMNATGDSDLRNYYDMLRARQTNDLSPAIETLDECLIRSALGDRPDEIYYEWAPLWQMTAAEKAEAEKKNAETDLIYAHSGLIPASAMSKAVQNRLVENATYPGLENALADAEAEGDVPMITEQLTPEEQFAQEAEIAAENAKAKAANQNTPRRRAANDARFTDATPRTLYVSRKLLNGGDFIAWAKRQGFETTVAASELHVTLAFSRQPVDWMKIPADWSFADKDGRLIVAPGGPRIVEPLGGEGAVVLFFQSQALAWRWQQIKEAGAEWEYPEFQPHVTITYRRGSLDLSTVEPYQGRLVFGPELFAEVEEEREVAEG